MLLEDEEMEVFNDFSAICLGFGFACALFALWVDQRERKQINQQAAMRRLIGADTRPHFMESEVPWKHTQWWKL